MSKVTQTPTNFSFVEAEENLIKVYIKDGYSRIAIAKKLRVLLEERGIFDDTTTFDEISSMKFLLEALLTIIASFLANTIAKSQFGMGKFTDQELYHQARNDDGLNLLVYGNNNIIIIFLKFTNTYYFF